MKMLFIFVVILCQTALAKTIYISSTGDDSNDGRMAAPFRTIKNAVAAASAGDTLNIGAGTFVEEGPVSLKTGLTLIGAGREATIITSTKSPIFRAIRVDDVSISDVTFDGNGHALQYAIYGGRTSNWEMKNFQAVDFEIAFRFINIYNSIFHDFVGHNASACNQAMFEFLVECFDVHVYNGYAFNSDEVMGKIVATGPDQSQNPDAPWTLPRGKVDYFVMHNVEHFTASQGCWEVAPGIFPPQICVEFWHSNVTNSEIFNCKFNNTISVQSNGSTLSADQKGLRIHHNRWDDCRGYAIEMACNNIEIDHNFIDGGLYPISNFGDCGIVNSRAKIHHNVFFKTTNWMVINMSERQQGLEFYNNTIYISGSKGLINLACASNSEIVMKNNIFRNYRRSYDIFNVAGTIDHNLFSNIVPKGENIITEDPLFVESGDLPAPFLTVSSTSPAIDKGVEIPGITDSFAGAAPDIGAFEYGQEPWTCGPTISLPTFVEEKSQKTHTAKEWNVIRNYPNPFNPMTKIIYHIPAPMFVELQVFDANGRHVSTLIKEFQVAGDHNIDFDGTNLPSGVYFYRLDTEHFQSHGKMILLR